MATAMTIEGEPPHIQAVLFDLDDTLYNRGTAFRAWATDFVTAIRPTAATQEIGDDVAFLIEADENGYRPRPEFVDVVYSRFPSISRLSVNDFVSAFRARMLTHITLEEGATRLIDVLNAHAILWGIVTNGSTIFQQRKIDHLGLSAKATCVVISEAFGKKKPLPSIFRHAAQSLGVEPNAILFVGDHIVNDIGGARNAGMRTAWLRRGRDWPPAGEIAAPDFVVDDLGELISTVSAWQRGSP